MSVIDAHLHLFKAVSEQYPRTVVEPMTPADREATADDFLTKMASAGVDRAVIVALDAHDEYLAKVGRDLPHRFVTVGVINDEASDQVGDIQRRVDEVGMQGLRLFTLGEVDEEPEGQPFNAILRTLADLGVKLWFYSSVEQLQLLDRSLSRFPELVVVLNHMGFCPDIFRDMSVDDHRRPRFDVPIPPGSLRVVEQIARRHDNVYVHFSGQYAFSREPYPYPDLRPVTARLLDAFGPERMLWASDYPWVAKVPGYDSTMGVVDHLLPGLSKSERAAILGGTAASLFAWGS